MINAWINENNKKRPNMKLSASKFNEKNVFRQFQKKYFFSQMSAVRTGVRAYMDATPLTIYCFFSLSAKVVKMNKLWIAILLMLVVASLLIDDR